MLEKPNKVQPPEILLKRFKTQEERDEFARTYKRAKRVLKEIHSEALKDIQAKQDNMDNPQGFEIANWAYYQAWNAGYRSAMKKTATMTRT